MPRFKRYKYEKWADHAVAAFNLCRPSTLAIDTETEGFAWEAKAFCATLTWRTEGKLYSYYIDLESDESGWRREQLRSMLAFSDVWVFHNAKFDLQKLELMDCLPEGWRDFARIEDTNIIHALLDENDRHGLKYLANKLLGESTNEDKVLAKVRRKLKIKKDEGYHLLPREIVAPYALKDTEFTLRLYELLKPKLPQDLHSLYQEELNTALALLDIESHGIGLNVPFIKKATSRLGVELMKLDNKMQELAAPENDAKFNPNSPKQITEAFARRGIKVTATDKATLGGMTDELAVTLLEYRRKKKLHGTYLVPMLAEQRDGIIHPNFNLTLPRTGRMSSSGATNN